MSLDSLRQRVESFLGDLEKERYQINLAQRRQPRLGSVYRDGANLLSISRITEVQRTLAGASGPEEKRVRALLEFLAHGHARFAASEELDQRLSWEIFGTVEVGESRIPCRQVSASLAISADPERRRAIEEVYLEVLEDHADIAEDFVSRHREGIEGLGYGSYVESCQILSGFDLHTLAREGARFLDETRDAYFDALAWYLPRVTGASIEEARAGDARRMAGAPEFDAELSGQDASRAIPASIGASGLEPLAEGRITIEREAYLAGDAGGVCHAFSVPDSVTLAVSTRSGRQALASFLRAYGAALHQAYTAPELPVEYRRLGDSSVLHGWGYTFEHLLRTRGFLLRTFRFPQAKLPDYLRFSALVWLYHVRQDIAQLQFELDFFDGDAGPDRFDDLMLEATGLRYDGRLAIWSVEPGFEIARRLRGAQLAGLLVAALRHRFDEDWFRNPRAGPYLAEQFSHGRTYSAPELAIQLTSRKLGFDGLSTEILGLM
jgi:hypothetical protein